MNSPDRSLYSHQGNLLYLVNRPFCWRFVVLLKTARAALRIAPSSAENVISSAIHSTYARPGESHPRADNHIENEDCRSSPLSTFRQLQPSFPGSPRSERPDLTTYEPCLITYCTCRRMPSNDRNLRCNYSTYTPHASCVLITPSKPTQQRATIEWRAPFPSPSCLLI
jgi:hypothetical protein